MKDKKGFTLVELIAVITILAVIVIIAVLSINSIKQKGLEKQKENLEYELITSAKKYIEDKNLNVVCVQTLIDEGKLSTDKDGYIKDPTNYDNLYNCYCYDLGTNKLKSESCEYAYSTSKTIEYYYSFDSSCSSPTKLTSNLFLAGKDIYISAKIDGKAAGIKTNTSPDASASYCYKIPYSNQGDSKTVRINVIDEDDNKYTRNLTINYDTKGPIISNITSSGLKVNFTISDDGAGIKGYTYTTNTTLPTTFTGISGSPKTKDIELTFPSSGTYYLWAVDNFDNKSTYYKVVVSNLTLTSMTMTSSNSNYNSRTVNITLSSSGSNDSIKEVCFVRNLSEESSCSWTNVANSYSYTFSEEDGSGANVKLYAIVKTTLGAKITKESSNYTIYKYCNSTGSPTITYGTCSKSCGTGTRSILKVTYDKYFTSYECSRDNTGTENCNTQSCCSDTSNRVTSYGDCNVACGNGTRTVYYKSYSNYDGSYCSSGSYSSTCTGSTTCSGEYVCNSSQSGCVDNTAPAATLYSVTAEKNCGTSCTGYEKNNITIKATDGGSGVTAYTITTTTATPSYKDATFTATSTKYIYTSFQTIYNYTRYVHLWDASGNHSYYKLYSTYRDPLKCSTGEISVYTRCQWYYLNLDNSKQFLYSFLHKNSATSSTSCYGTEPAQTTPSLQLEKQAKYCIGFTK